MPKQEYLNFAEISKSILFKDVFDWLNIAYKQTEKELKGEDFIVSLEKNLFFTPKDPEKKGSIINFVSQNKGIGLREAASLLKEQFLTQKEDNVPKRDIPNLTLLYDEYIVTRKIDTTIATEYEVGLVKQRSIVSGRIAFKMHDADGISTGYIGYKVADNSWFFPKGFKRKLYNFHRAKEYNSVIVTMDPFDALWIISLGYKNTVSLVGQSMTTEQEQQLEHFEYILLLHKEPVNVVNRVFKKSYVKAPALEKQIQEMSDEEMYGIIKKPL